MNISGARLHLSARGMPRGAKSERERAPARQPVASMYRGGRRALANFRPEMTREKREEDADSAAEDFYTFSIRRVPFPAAPSPSLLMMILIPGYGSIVHEYLRITYLFARVPVRALAHRPPEGC